MPRKKVDNRAGDRHRKSKSGWRLDASVTDAVRKRSAIRGVAASDYVRAVLEYYWSRVGADGSALSGTGLLDPQNPDCYSDDGTYVGFNGDADESGYEFVPAQGDPLASASPRPRKKRIIPELEAKQPMPAPARARRAVKSMAAMAQESARLLREADVREKAKFLAAGGREEDWDA